MEFMSPSAVAFTVRRLSAPDISSYSNITGTADAIGPFAGTLASMYPYQRDSWPAGRVVATLTEVSTVCVSPSAGVAVRRTV